MSIAEALTTAEHVVRVLPKVASDIAADYPNEAALLRTMTRALESKLRSAAVVDEKTPPEGTYLVRLSEELGGPYMWLSHKGAKFLVDLLREARQIGVAFMATLEVYGTDLDLIKRFQDWLEKVDQGPPRGEL